MTDWIFDPPGNVKDFSEPAKWHAEMTRQAADIVVLLLASVLNKRPEDVTEADITKHGAELAYANPVEEKVPASAETMAVRAWGGFPRAVVRRGPWNEFAPTETDPNGIYRAVQHLGDEDFAPGIFVDAQNRVLHLPVRDRQDEYLEWNIKQDSDGKISKITFVAEGYDYFSKLFERDEKKVVEIYKDFLGNKSIDADSLRASNGVYRHYDDGRREQVAKSGGFNPRNWHNIQDGIVHLSHRANSLGAEVNLAGVSGIARKIASGATLDGADAEKLLCCNLGGNPNRNSDPLISQQAYAQVLGSFRYTLANPVGLYIAGIDEQSVLLPDNRTPVPREWWSVVRGDDLWDLTKSRVLRLELAVPSSEKGLTVSDLTIGGARIEHPGQIAELLSVHLFVTRWKRADAGIGPVISCAGTCCGQTGSDQLTFADEQGKCQPGWSLRFPDLLDSPGAEFMSDAVILNPSRRMMPLPPERSRR